MIILLSDIRQLVLLLEVQYPTILLSDIRLSIVRRHQVISVLDIKHSMQIRVVVKIRLSDIKALILLLLAQGILLSDIVLLQMQLEMITLQLVQIQQPLSLQDQIILQSVQI